MPRARARLPRLVALAFALAAAGGAAGALALARGGEEPASARLDDGAVTLRLDDFLVSPQSVRGESGRVRITAVNRGRLPHTLRLRHDGRELDEVIRTLKPGERGTLTAELRPGGYRMFCAIGNHEELGLWGTLVLR